ncbi:hypothetical protein ACGC1H_000899 [Rhizoctonia solani]
MIITGDTFCPRDHNYSVSLGLFIPMPSGTKNPNYSNQNGLLTTVCQWPSHLRKEIPSSVTILLLVLVVGFVPAFKRRNRTFLLRYHVCYGLLNFPLRQGSQYRRIIPQHSWERGFASRNSSHWSLPLGLKSAFKPSKRQWFRRMRYFLSMEHIDPQLKRGQTSRNGALGPLALINAYIHIYYVTELPVSMDSFLGFGQEPRS